MINSLKVIFWNCRSVCNKYYELFDFLCNHKIDICLLSETWLNKQHRFNHPAYNCVRSDMHGRIGGGVAILIKKSINFAEAKIIDTNFIENVGIELLTHDQSKFYIYSVYFPGAVNTNSNRNKFKSDLRKLVSAGGKYLLCGDLNSKHRNWGCSHANAWGNMLYDFSIFFPVTILFPHEPTYIPANDLSLPAVLDIILCNTSQNISQLKSVNALGSDHLPVKFDLITNGISNDNLLPDYSNTDWRLYKSYLNAKCESYNQVIDSIVSSDQIDSLVDSFTANIDEAARLSVPKK